MIVMTYGIYDAAAKEFVRTFVAKNDDVAKRSCKYIVREQGFDRIAGKDYVVQHLHDMDSETGLIVNNEVRLVCPLASEIAELEAEEAVKREQMMRLQRPLPKEEVKEDESSESV